MRRRVELAVAVAQERLLSTHVNHALGLIQLVGDQVPFENALNIYTRMLRLSDDEARVITTRALAILGERAADTDQWPEFVNAETAPPPQTGETARRKFEERAYLGLVARWTPRHVCRRWPRDREK